MKRIVFIFVVLFCSSLLMAQNTAKTFESAKEAVENGRYEEGIDYFRKQLRSDPKDWVSAYYVVLAAINVPNYREVMEASEVVIRYGEEDALPFIYRCRGFAFQNDRKDYEKAIEEYTRAIRIDKKDYLAYAFRGYVYRIMSIEEMKGKNEFDTVTTYQRIVGSKTGEKNLKRSDSDFERIVELEPDNACGYAGLAMNSYIRRETKEALEYGQRAIAATTQNDANVYWLVLNILSQEERWSEACDIYIKGLSSNLSMISSFFSVEEVLVDNCFTTLLSKLQIQSNKEGNDAQWPYAIGRLYGKRYNHVKQIEYYKKAYARQPTSDWYATRVAEAMVEVGNLTGAIAYANRAIDLNAKNSSAYYIRSAANYYSGKGEDAIADISYAIELAPTNGFYYYRRGFYNDNLRHTDDAIEDYSAAIELMPDHAYSYLGRGDMYEIKGQHSLARKDYRKAVSLDTVPGENSCAQYAYLQLGDTMSAIRFTDVLIDSLPYNAGVLYDAACLYSRIGRTKQALDYLESSLRAGYTSIAHMLLDDDLDALRESERYKQLMEKYKPKVFPEEELPNISGRSNSEYTDMPTEQNTDERSRNLRSLAPRQ